MRGNLARVVPRFAPIIAPRVYQIYRRANYSDPGEYLKENECYDQVARWNRGLTMRIRNLQYIFFVFELLFVSPHSWASCPGDRVGQGELQWSKASSIRSLTGQWQLEVRPVLTSDENESPVVLRRCATEQSKVVLILERNASVYFSPSGDEFLIINRPVRNKHEILIGRSPDLLANDKYVLNRKVGAFIYDAVSKALYPSQPVFFLPKLLKWRNGAMSFMVGGQAAVKGRQKISDYCFRADYLVVGGNVDVKPAKAQDGKCVFYP